MSYDDFIKEYAFNAISWDGYLEDSEAPKNDAEKIAFIAKTFQDEYGWIVPRVGILKGVSEWLQGLPSTMDIIFYNYDILEQARNNGFISKDADENEEDSLIERYWKCLALGLVKLMEYGRTVDMNHSVVSVLDSSRVNDLLLILPDVVLDRSVYLAVKKVIDALGGKWSTAKKGFLFDANPLNIINDFCLTGEYVNRKKDLQFFETPKKLAARLVELANIKEGESVLEPSAGHGRIAELLNDPLCIEIDRLNVEALRNKGIGVLEFDFLKDKALQGQDSIDVVVANPPFSRQQDIDHVTKMISVAKRRIVSIMSASVIWRDNKKTLEFRKLISRYKHEFIELDSGVFAESGTNVKTVILVLDK